MPPEPSWFAEDPGSDETRAPLFYGRSLVEKIRRCPVPQEIGSHSFSHLLFGEPGCTPEAARDDLEWAVKVAGDAGLHLETFVYPRHSQGFVELLPEHGFRCYRGELREPFSALPTAVRLPVSFAAR